MKILEFSLHRLVDAVTRAPAAFFAASGARADEKENISFAILARDGRLLCSRLEVLCGWGWLTSA